MSTHRSPFSSDSASLIFPVLISGKFQYKRVVSNMCGRLADQTSGYSFNILNYGIFKM